MQTIQNNITPAQIKSMVNGGHLRELHTSLTRGYVSRKSDGVVVPYTGRFGAGFRLLTPNFESTQYCHATYYVHP